MSKGDTGLGMAPGTSPAIAGLAGGGYEVVFQANTGNLYKAGAADPGDTGLGMAPGASPAAHCPTRTRTRTNHRRALGPSVPRGKGGPLGRLPARPRTLYSGRARPMETSALRIELPSGVSWPLVNANDKLSQRARLPGARLFDMVAESLESARHEGRLSTSDRFTLALPASWLVNSPAISRVLRRWALPPHRDTCLSLVDLLASGPEGWEKDPSVMGVIKARIASLGDEPYVIEALSKVMALLVPHAVPLLPASACAFLLGPADGSATLALPSGADAFLGAAQVFAGAVRDHEEDLAAIARAHSEVRLTPGGVLDRLLWFDSEGFRHFLK